MFGQTHTRRSRAPLVGVLLVALILSGGLFWYLNRVADERGAPTTPRSTPSAADEDDAAATSSTPRPETSAETDAETPSRAPSRKPSAAASRLPYEPPPPELRVDSDVPGAMVFVNRKFLGKTPLVTRNVKPGTHQLNVVAEGYDAVARTIDVGEDGTAITVELKKVTVDETVKVVHKHTFGSCEGRLEASIDGLRYVTSNADDAFSLQWSQIGAFSVDYMDKTLRVEQQGGRTWNFTTQADNADPLFVFHRDVEKAREQAQSQ